MEAGVLCFIVFITSVRVVDEKQDRRLSCCGLRSENERILHKKALFCSLKVDIYEKFLSISSTLHGTARASTHQICFLCNEAAHCLAYDQMLSRNLMVATDLPAPHSVNGVVETLLESSSLPFPHVRHHLHMTKGGACEGRSM